MFFNRGKGKVLPFRQICAAIKNFVGSSYPVKALLNCKLKVNQEHLDVLKENNLV